jgi:hypothetical protein
MAVGMDVALVPALDHLLTGDQSLNVAAVWLAVIGMRDARVIIASGELLHRVAEHLRERRVDPERPPA